VILMLARWLAERREAPATLRDLLWPCVIAGLPTLLVIKQPDLGSAMVFITILFAMLYWAGTKPSLLVLLGSPVIGLALAFSTVAWGAWIIVLLALLLWWRPYVWEGLAVMLANLVMASSPSRSGSALRPTSRTGCSRSSTRSRIPGPQAGT